MSKEKLSQLQVGLNSAWSACRLLHCMAPLNVAVKSAEELSGSRLLGLLLMNRFTLTFSRKKLKFTAYEINMHMRS